MKASEAEFQSAIIRLARLNGWRVYHPPDNRPARNGRVQSVEPGFPDLTLVRDGELIFAELKTSTGRVRPEQHEWLTALALVPGVETYIWRPGDFDAIHARLAGHTRLCTSSGGSRGGSAGSCLEGFI